MTIADWQVTAADTLDIDWNAVELHLGFAVHAELRSLFSRIVCTERWGVRGCMEYRPAELVKEYSNRPDWLVDANGDGKYAEYTLRPLQRTDTDYVCDFFEDAFSGDWTGGNDFGHRAYIGEFIINIGQISLIFNNDTGRFEWVDFGWGYCDVYEDNPYGIIADTAQEFLDKFHDDDIDR